MRARGGFMKIKNILLSVLLGLASVGMTSCASEKKKALEVVDFVVEVDAGKDVVVLQLTDPQIVHANPYAYNETSEELCYRYLRETVEATNPDLIIVTGDLVYGKFDPTGESWLEYIQVMESFDIPWAPVMGNHDPECEMGIDWQCEQLENAENCLFKQRELSGNGNYSVGVLQGGKLQRVFYMLDSNGATGASEKSKANGHTFATVGFLRDQIEWYTQSITALKNAYPSVKLSFAYHIPQSAFEGAYLKYGYGGMVTGKEPVHIDKAENKEEGDFGWIVDGTTSWDVGNSIFNGIKELGVDSLFVGHEHSNSASIVYKGVRFQFGQKSSRYDSYNKIDADGNLSEEENALPLIGGTVIPLSEADGTITRPYIYLC